MFCNRNHYNKAVQGARWDWFFFFFFFFFFLLICKMIIIFLCVFVLTAWCAFTYVLLPYVLYVVTECNRKIDIWNLDSRINSRMEPEVYNNMMKCITNALSPKRVSDPAYGKDWLIDWLNMPLICLTTGSECQRISRHWSHGSRSMGVTNPARSPL